MAYNNLIAEKNDGISIITINRPKQLNALNIETIKEIGEAVNSAIQDSNINGIIITGSGEKAFVAGADIKEFLSFSEEEGSEMARNGHSVFNQIENSPKPVIAAIDGFALGGGCELAMACHMRIASEKSKFGQPEVNLGLIPGYGGTQRLIQCIGKSRATEFLMTANMISSAQAESWGLVNYVVKREEVIEKATELLRTIATKSPNAIAGIVRCIKAHYDENTDGFETEINEFGACFQTEDFKEGTDAFMNKRKANFKR